jgi:hypothetical protein
LAIFIRVRQVNLKLLMLIKQLMRKLNLLMGEGRGEEGSEAVNDSSIAGS